MNKLFQSNPLITFFNNNFKGWQERQTQKIFERERISFHYFIMSKIDVKITQIPVKYFG